jgi:hypothetical protein
MVTGLPRHLSLITYHRFQKYVTSCFSSRVCDTACVRLARQRLDTIKNPCFSRFRKAGLPPLHVSVNHFLYFFQIFKERLNTVSQQKLISKPSALRPWLTYHFLHLHTDFCVDMNGGG